MIFILLNEEKWRKVGSFRWNSWHFISDSFSWVYINISLFDLILLFFFFCDFAISWIDVDCVKELSIKDGWWLRDFIVFCSSGVNYISVCRLVPFGWLRWCLDVGKVEIEIPSPHGETWLWRWRKPTFHFIVVWYSLGKLGVERVSRGLSGDYWWDFAQRVEKTEGEENSLGQMLPWLTWLLKCVIVTVGGGHTKWMVLITRFTYSYER